MITVQTTGCTLKGGKPVNVQGDLSPQEKLLGRSGTMAYKIFKAHDTSASPEAMQLKFDALMSHDITYVGIIQTARASGLERFPLPFVLTNCHNSLCAVGGTINNDDHAFGHSACMKYGGEFVPAHVAVIHQYAREMMAKCGGMILGSDSHTRYGALGCLGVGEGGGELVKQLLSKTYDMAPPEVVCVYLTGKPRPGVGPHDVAIALVGATFNDGIVKNRVLEFVGPGVGALSVDFRMGIDVMTTETACLTSIWETDELVENWLAAHGRKEDFKSLHPSDGAYYDRLITIDLDKVEPMIALPFHPGNAFTIREFKSNMNDLLDKVMKDAEKRVGPVAKQADLRSKVRNGKFYVDQAVVAGCAGGTYENLFRMNQILGGQTIGSSAFELSLYASSEPVFFELSKLGIPDSLTRTGATFRTAFCGPCFGAGDTPSQNGFSIRHTTRNFPNREGSKPAGGQIAFVALMDARSIAATALRQGELTGADELPNAPQETPEAYGFDGLLYKQRVYHGWQQPKPEEPLRQGPNIVDWPAMDSMPDNLLLKVASAIYDPVTTTDELIPSGETSSYRSNPIKMSEFTLGRRDPAYVGRAKAIAALEAERKQGVYNDEMKKMFAAAGLSEADYAKTGVSTLVFALKPGDGSAREQAASCQKVLGGWANIAAEYATKRYRGNLVNWGLLPFIMDNAEQSGMAVGDIVYLPNIREQLMAGKTDLEAVWVHEGKKQALTLHLPQLTSDERDVLVAGSLINYYRGNA